MSERKGVASKMTHIKPASLTMAIALLAALPAAARSLDVIRAEGAIGLCAHPNSLPFASRADEPPGFQIEFGRALAHRLGLRLRPEWVVTMYQVGPAGCDIVLDTIADPQAQGETRLRLSQPYYRTGVMLAVPNASRLHSLADLDGQTPVGVQVGSLAAMLLGKRAVALSVFGFEVDSLEAMAAGEIAAAAVTPASAGWYNLAHPDRRVRLIDLAGAEPQLSWNVAVGMIRPDPALGTAIDDAVAALRGDGTVAAIYGRYGITVEPPR